MFGNLTKIYYEYSPKYWTLVLASFIDRLGGALIFPFFALYVTERFDVGMVEVGKLFAIFAISGMAGSVLGGALTDKFGRRTILLFGLVFSALGSVLMGLVDRLSLFFILAAVVGVLGDIAGPAHQAMVADLVPAEEKRAEAYGVLRVAANLAVAIGPAIGGLLATRWSYLLLFILDAITSLAMAVIVVFSLPETKPEPVVGQEKESLLKTFSGYYRVTKDAVFMAFMLASILMVMVYTQMNSTLSVFLRDVHGVSASGFGYILSLNAGMVVLFQFWVTRKIGKKPPMLVMAVGTGFYLVGFLMYGFVSQYVLFLLAMVIITIGEMLVVPVSNSVVANLAPAAMRGRYMAVSGFSYIIPFAIGPLAAGYIMDQYDPNWVWYGCGILAAVAVLAFVALHGWLTKRERNKREAKNALLANSACAQK